MDILQSDALHMRALPAEYDNSTKTIGNRLVELAKEHNALGLAAPQIGISIQIICVKLNNGEYVVVCNPQITMYGGDLKRAWEGCLSIPGYLFLVNRTERIQVKGFDMDGNPVNYKARGLEARVFQHEIDHLRGIMLSGRSRQMIEEPKDAVPVV